MKKIYLFSILSIFSMNLFCQVHWTKHLENPVMTAGPEVWEDVKLAPGSVIFYDGNYHMWYSGGDFPVIGGDFLIGHATSPDGISWTKDIENPVLNKATAGAWDDNGVFDPSVILMDTIFHMWFSGYSDNGIYHSIGHATSIDGVTWIRDVNNPVLEIGSSGNWDDHGIISPSVVFNGSEYHMYFHAEGNSASGVFIGHATSPDGVAWTKDPQNPVLSPGPSGSWDYGQTLYPEALFDGNTYHMWYGGGASFAWDIGYATSEDGSIWTKYDGNPVLVNGEAGSFESSIVSLSSVIIDSSSFKMWYRGQRADGNGGIGYAESSPFVNIPNTAFLHALIDEEVDTNGDSLISYVEAESITSVDVSDRGIVDMTGIEAFINLDTLDCSLNSITSLDLLKNTRLKDLNCTQCQLSSLNVSKNILLEWLSCWNNELTSLDISNNPVLIGLYIQRNQINTLDLSNNTTINYLRCRGNQFTKLDVSNNNSLKVLSIDEMPMLFEVCVWELPFPPEGVEIDTTDSPNVCFETDCNGTCSTTGINSNSPTGLSIYPNPTNNMLTIETNRSAQHTVEITSLNGQLLYSDIMDSPTHQIDLSSFQKGLYFITVRSRDFVRTEKIIKL